MAIEQITEQLTREALQIWTAAGKTDFGAVYPQGDVPEGTKLQECLKKCGGKPVECSLKDYNKGGSGKAKPEFIITFNSEPDLIVVVECKKTAKNHTTEGLDKPKDYYL